MIDSDDEIDKRLKKLLLEVFKIDDVSMNFSMDDIPEWDSFTHFKLIVALEEEFNIKIGITEATEFLSIPIIKTKILSLMNEK